MKKLIYTFCARLFVIIFILTLGNNINLFVREITLPGNVFNIVSFSVILGSYFLSTHLYYRIVYFKRKRSILIEVLARNPGVIYFVLCCLLFVNIVENDITTIHANVVSLSLLIVIFVMSFFEWRRLQKAIVLPTRDL